MTEKGPLQGVDGADILAEPGFGPDEIADLEDRGVECLKQNP